MSNFNCPHCGKPCIDSPRGYVTGCEHYPADVKEETSETEAISDTLKWFYGLQEDETEPLTGLEGEKMAVIGPNGKDIYPVALAFDKGKNNIEVYTVLVEALSEDEAYGIGAKAGRALLRDVPRWGQLVFIRVGVSDTFDEQRSKFICY